MQKLVQGIVALAIGYGVCWTVVYLIVMGGDVRFFFEYLALAWTDPGELPALIQLYSVALLLVLAVVAFVVAMFRRRNSGRRAR